jgi:hypothetical protein
MLGPVATQLIADKTGHAKAWGTHLITLYVWLLAGTATSVLAHTGFRTSWNDPGKHGACAPPKFHSRLPSGLTVL